MTDPTREQMFEEGRRQARIYGVVPLFVEMYAEGWAAAMGRADRAIDEAQRAADKSLWSADLNAGLAYKGKIASLERRLLAVLGYVAKLECSNCEHVHEEGWCNFAYEGGGNCGCGWGPPQVTKDIRDLLKERPDGGL